MTRSIAVALLLVLAGCSAPKSVTQPLVISQSPGYVEYCVGPKMDQSAASLAQDHCSANSKNAVLTDHGRYCWSLADKSEGASLRFECK